MIHFFFKTYPQDQELARQVIELGYKGSGGEVLRREEFEARKQAAEASRLSKRSQQKYLFMLIIIQLYIKEARAGCRLKNRLREFFFIFAYVIFMVFRIYLCAKNHTSP